MIEGSFRPWGYLSWVLSRLPKQRWPVIGCVSTEDRCLATTVALHAGSQLGELRILEAVDPPSRFSVRAEELLVRNRAEFRRCSDRDPIHVLDLFATDGQIVEWARSAIAAAGGSLIVDISSMPKRFFFPLLKLALGDASIDDLLVTYTIPKGYYPGALAEDHLPLKHLPLFGPHTFPEAPASVAFVGIGFLPLGLPDLLEPYRDRVNVKLMLPFPPGPPAYQRNWKFVSDLRQSLPPSVGEPIRTAANDLPDCFARIVQETERGHKVAVFAPYGPKPMSLAMCLFATLTSSSVFYTQPRVYNPEYSFGVSSHNGVREIYCYCVRLQGKDLYAL